MLIVGKTKPTSACCREPRPSWALVGAGCNNQMQVPQRQALVRGCALMQAAFGLLHPTPTSAQDGLGSLQLVLVVFFLSSISAKTSLALVVGMNCNYIALVVFVLYQQVQLLICAHMTGNHAVTNPCNFHWWCFPQATRHLLMWPHVYK